MQHIAAQPSGTMRVATMQRLAMQPAGARLPARSASRSTSRRSPMVVRPRAQQGSGQAAEEVVAAAAAPVAAAEQQAAAAASAAVQAVADTAEEQLEEQAETVSYAAQAAAPAEQQAAARQVAAPEPQPAAAAGGPLAGLNLQHPGVKIAGYSAAAFLGGTLLITLFRMARDPQRRRSKTINKNKLVVDTISKYLPGNRAGLNSGSFTVLKVQTGFSNVEVFRKYLWFLLRERQYDEEALGDLVALKGALGLSDEQVAEALRERAQRVYEKYGTVMVNMEGMTQAGIERKAASRNLFIKLLSLTEARSLLGAEAAASVDLGKIFGVTQRDVLTLRSGYSAEVEGGEQGGPEGANTDDE